MPLCIEGHLNAEDPIQGNGPQAKDSNCGTVWHRSIELKFSPMQYLPDMLINAKGVVESVDIKLNNLTKNTCRLINSCEVWQIGHRLPKIV